MPPRQSLSMNASRVRAGLILSALLLCVPTTHGQALEPPAQICPMDMMVLPELSRYETQPQVWTGPGDTGPRHGPPNTATPATLTYSFPPDGVAWGLPNLPGGLSTILPGINDHNRYFVAYMGLSDIDLGRELIRQMLSTWGATTGLSYDEVADDGVPMDNIEDRVPTRGDIRFGGFLFNNSTFFAYNTFPTDDLFPGLGGGDYVLNTGPEFVSQFSDSNDMFKVFRSAVLHEHGHALGFSHVWPAPGISWGGEKVMESASTGHITSLHFDDMMAVHANYGDFISPSHDSATAHNLGNIGPGAGSSIARNLSTNGAFDSISNPEGNDYYQFTLLSSSSLEINVTPVGGAFWSKPNSACDETCPCIYGHFPTCAFDIPMWRINSRYRADLNLELLDSNLSIIAQSNITPGFGISESISLANAPAGDYFIRVSAVLAQSPEIQLYDLSVLSGSEQSPPSSRIGLNKSIPAGEPCYFIGDLLSETNEPGATLDNNSYDWDLDGDGAFETLDDPRPTYTYASAGDVTVTLRLTDSNGMSATDSITVTVYDGPVITRIANAHATGVSPGFLWRDRTTPVVIYGERLDEFLNEYQLIWHDETLVVTGIPTVMNNGTEVHGLSVTTPATASCDPLKASVTTSRGFGSLEVASTVTLQIDLDGNCVVDTADLGRLLGEFGDSGPALRGDVNEDGTVDTADLALLLAGFGNTCGQDCN